MILTETDTLPEVILDWREYYLAFRQEHGDPVQYMGRLLFADGWRYSALDYAGPEWPPPEDEANLRGLKIAYWRLRRSVVSAKADTLQIKLRAISGLQSGKSISLPLKYYAKEMVPGFSGELKELDVTAWDDLLIVLRQDVENCDLRLRELGVNDGSKTT